MEHIDYRKIAKACHRLAGDLGTKPVLIDQFVRDLMDSTCRERAELLGLRVIGVTDTDTTDGESSVPAQPEVAGIVTPARCHSPGRPRVTPSGPAASQEEND